jgi:hypothetical protein
MIKSTRSNKHTNASKTRKRKFISINDIRKRFNDMDTGVRVYLKKGMNSLDSLSAYISRQWTKLFKKPITLNASKSLAQHYMSLYGKKKGGSAPIDWEMRPGLPAVMTYATFPTEVGTDPKAVQNLDVYYNTALSRSCGTENTSATVPSDMGSNQVPVKGGNRKCKSKHNKKIQNNNRKTRKLRNKRGGDFATALGARAYVASNPTAPLQRGLEQLHGLPPNYKDSPDPTNNQLTLMSPPSIPRPPVITHASGNLNMHAKL